MERLEPHLRGMGCHSPHSVTCHLTKMNTPALTPAMQASTRFTYPGGMEGWVDLGDLLHAEMVYLPTEQTVTYPGTNAAVHVRELNSLPLDHKSDALTATLPRYLYCIATRTCLFVHVLCWQWKWQEIFCWPGVQGWTASLSGEYY